MSWMQLYTGNAFVPSNVDAGTQTYQVADIAVALGRLCRFAGHTLAHYSVAEHSLLVLRLVADQGADGNVCRAALLHDAAEAYLADLPSPIKRLPELEGYRRLEARIMSQIYGAFGVTVDAATSKLIRTSDRMALGIEARTALGPNISRRRWPDLPDPPDVPDFDPDRYRVRFLDGHQATAQFLGAAEVLGLRGGRCV